MIDGHLDDETYLSSLMRMDKRTQYVWQDLFNPSGEY